MTFLTIFPVARNLDRGPMDLSNSRAFYPAVGLLMGLLLVGIEAGSDEIFTAPITAAFLVAAMVIITRALHMDGLMDVCDGLFGGFTPERRLEIMRDSQVGAFGVAGGVTVLQQPGRPLHSVGHLPGSFASCGDCPHRQRTQHRIPGFRLCTAG